MAEVNTVEVPHADHRPGWGAVQILQAIDYLHWFPLDMTRRAIIDSPRAKGKSPVPKWRNW